MTAPLDDNAIVWTQKVSANGKPFEVGFQKLNDAGGFNNYIL